jgi:hypothetical protein
MSIRLSFSRGSMKTEAVLKDSALGELMQLIAEHETEEVTPAQSTGTRATSETKNSSPTFGDDRIGKTKQWLSGHTASEVLNRIKWDTFSDKILLLGAFYEAHGGQEGWKAAEINEQFNKAKEPFPANFPRDIRIAIGSGNIGAVSPRTYKVGRTGWNKVADAIERLG